MKTFSTIIIITVTSLALAGMSGARPMGKHMGPLKQKPHKSTGLGYGPAKKFVEQIKGKKVPKPPAPYRGMSHPRAHRIFADN